MAPRPLPRLHVVTDDAVLARADFVARAREALGEGGPGLALHLRGRGTSGARLFALAAELGRAGAAAGALVLANDRVDVARAAGLDGAHLPENSLPLEAARALLPAGSWLGGSVHDEAGARAAAPHADYLVMGTLFATLSHPGRSAAGPEGMARVRAAVSLPLFAIGGITPARLPRVLAAGAAGVAVLSGVWGAPDTAAAVRAYLDGLPAEAAAESPALTASAGLRP